MSQAVFIQFGVSGPDLGDQWFHSRQNLSQDACNAGRNGALCQETSALDLSSLLADTEPFHRFLPASGVGRVGACQQRADTVPDVA